MKLLILTSVLCFLLGTFKNKIFPNYGNKEKGSWGETVPSTDFIMYWIFMICFMIPYVNIVAVAMLLGHTIGNAIGKIKKKGDDIKDD